MNALEPFYRAGFNNRLRARTLKYRCARAFFRICQHDQLLPLLVERLKSVSPEFVEWWPRHDARQMSEGRRDYHHPLVGRMIVEHATFLVGDNPELRLFVLLPAAESNSIAKVRKVITAFRGGASSPSSGVHGRNKTRNSRR